MKRTMIQRQVQALSEDLREISQGLEEEEKEAQRAAKENEERSKRGEPPAPYQAIRRGEIKQELEFVQERLASTIKTIGVATTSFIITPQMFTTPRDP